MATKKSTSMANKTPNHGVTQSPTSTTIIAPVNWVVLMFVSVMLTMLSLIVFSSGLKMSGYFIVLKTGNLMFGFILMVLAGVSWGFFVRNLITDAHVKALEVFYGTERKVIN